MREQNAITYKDNVSRQAVLNIIDNMPTLHNSSEGGRMFMAWSDAWKKVEALPAAEKRPEGKWIDIMVGEMPAQACDQCGTFFPLVYTGGGHRFCPSCGAKMMSEESEEQDG